LPVANLHRLHGLGQRLARPMPPRPERSASSHDSFYRAAAACITTRASAQRLSGQAVLAGHG
jgi:hypothetical protein